MTIEVLDSELMRDLVLVANHRTNDIMSGVELLTSAAVFDLCWAVTRERRDATLTEVLDMWRTLAARAEMFIRDDAYPFCADHALNLEKRK